MICFRLANNNNHYGDWQLVGKSVNLSVCFRKETHCSLNLDRSAKFGHILTFKSPLLTSPVKRDRNGAHLSIYDNLIGKEHILTGVSAVYQSDETLSV